MFNRNRIELTGNICKAPETRPVGETSVTLARLIHNETIPRKNGEPLERVTAIDVEIWGKSGEAFAEHVTTKRPVYIEGRLQQDQWEKGGERHSRLVVRAAGWQFLTPKPIQEPVAEAVVASAPVVAGVV